MTSVMKIRICLLLTLNERLSMENNIPSSRKYRHELKYLCTQAQLSLAENKIRGICRRDRHAGEDGRYTVRSLYFDDYYNTCYYENENGVDPREKFRIRIYNGSPENILLECKQKCREKCYKESTKLTQEQCRSMMEGSFRPELEHAHPLLRKFFLNSRQRLLRPAVIVEYVRTPYIYETGNVRITFDRYISSSGRLREFLEPNIPKRPIMNTGQHVMEVKYDELLPDVIYNQLQLDGLRRTTFSKYYLCRRHRMR